MTFPLGPHGLFKRSQDSGKVPRRSFWDHVLNGLDEPIFKRGAYSFGRNYSSNTNSFWKFSPQGLGKRSGQCRVSLIGNWNLFTWIMSYCQNRKMRTNWSRFLWLFTRLKPSHLIFFISEPSIILLSLEKAFNIHSEIEIFPQQYLKSPAVK